MKRNLFMIMAAVAAFAFIGCGEDSKTELQFKNSEGSDGKINDIVWEDGDQTWNSTTGWKQNELTGSKEVSKTTGTITKCTLTPDSTSGDLPPVAEPDILFDLGNSNFAGNISLNEGSSQTFIVQVLDPETSGVKKK